MLPRAIIHIGNDFLVRLSAQILHVPRHLNRDLSNSGGIILRIVLDNILHQAQQDLDAMANQVIIRLLINIPFSERILLRGITIEEPSLFARIVSFINRSNCVHHYLARKGGASARKLSPQFFFTKLARFNRLTSKQPVRQPATFALIHLALQFILR